MSARRRIGAGFGQPKDLVALCSEAIVIPAAITGRVCKGSPNGINTGYQPQAAATGFTAGAPPVMLEYSRCRWLGMSQPIDRFALNPGGEYYAAISGTPPSMFGGGDLPILTGSGVDPSMLRWSHGRSGIPRRSPRAAPR